MTKSHARLEGKTALVTGSTSGIGRAIAQAFADEGATVFVHGRDVSAAQTFATTIGGIAVAADLASEAGLDTLVSSVRRQIRSLDVLVNNAGTEIGRGIGSIGRDVLERTMSVNFVAPALLVKGLLAELTSARRASVINVGSIHSDIPAFGNLAYSASKAALDTLTRTASIELAPHGIRVNTLTPGAILTDHNRALISEIGEDSFNEWIPAGRLGAPEDLVGPALFLASAESEYVTGANLAVDGGYRHHLVRYRSTTHE